MGPVLGGGACEFGRTGGTNLEEKMGLVWGGQVSRRKGGKMRFGSSK